jgi:hypothetical protein
MSNIGKFAINKSGYRILLKNGRTLVFNKNDICAECCKPYILATYRTYSGNSRWDLTPFQGNGIATPNTVWRIRELGYNLTYYSGVVDVLGKLVGLPNAFVSGYSYSGYMQLEIGCYNTNGTTRWS